MDNLEYFNRILKPIYYVSGNHEYYLLNFEDKLSQLSKYNIKFLNNQTLTINDITLIGVSDNISIKQKVNFVKKNSNKNTFNITLVHKPNIWENIKLHTDLMLSGHTHNGQIFSFNLSSNNLNIYMDYIKIKHPDFMYLQVLVVGDQNENWFKE